MKTIFTPKRFAMKTILALKAFSLETIWAFRGKNRLFAGMVPYPLKHVTARLQALKTGGER